MEQGYIHHSSPARPVTVSPGEAWRQQDHYADSALIRAFRAQPTFARWARTPPVDHLFPGAQVVTYKNCAKSREAEEDLARQSQVEAAPFGMMRANWWFYSKAKPRIRTRIFEILRLKKRRLMLPLNMMLSAEGEGWCQGRH
jgi:hypothetical protein